MSLRIPGLAGKRQDSKRWRRASFTGQDSDRIARQGKCLPARHLPETVRPPPEGDEGEESLGGEGGLGEGLMCLSEVSHMVGRLWSELQRATAVRGRL